MEKTIKFKKSLMLLALILSAAWCGGTGILSVDGGGAILIKESKVQSVPKGSSIQASINDHTLTVVFTENLGQVEIAITTSAGVPVETLAVVTPNGTMFNIPLPGDYIVTFTLPNGDEYYGEFTVTD